MKKTTAWAITEHGKLWSRDFFRVRTDAQIYAGRRAMGSPYYKAACAPEESLRDMCTAYSYSNAKAAGRVWRALKKRHTTMRLVRVKVSL